MNKRIKVLLCGLLLVIIVFIVVNFENIQYHFLKKEYVTEFSDYVYEHAECYDVDPILIFAIIKTESDFNIDSVSVSGAKGLMQLMDTTAEEQALIIGLDEYDIFDPHTNILFGTRYISSLLDFYEDNIYLALASYNAGMGNVNKWIQDGVIKADGSDIENVPFKETRNYVRKVMRNYKIYEKIIN